MSSAFVGQIPAYYDRHLGPVLFEPYAIELARRVPRDARRVLELAAGTGRLTRQLLATLGPDAELVVTDLNGAMLEQARRALSDPRATWEVADAQELPFAAASFDVVVCQFGLMFVPDKRRVLAETLRVLRPGGVMLVSTWDTLAKNPATDIAHALAIAAFRTDPPAFYLTPFSMADPAAVCELVRAAGFAEVRAETVAITGVSESAAHLAIGLVRGNPFGGQLAERGLDPAAFEGKLAAALAATYGDAPCTSPLSAHVFTAHAPPS